MASRNEVLRALTNTTWNHPLKVREIVGILKADAGVVSVQLNRLSKQGLVSKRGEKGGWYISRRGKQRLQLLAGPSTENIRSREEGSKAKLARELAEAIRSNKGMDYGKFLSHLPSVDYL